ncbi:flagella synthesis protein FlgN [Pseudomonas japonica]|uniref:Flagella synthesis protein FlgN n=1 Tax=Pseudomonas japonica TaxID=256466 RepID=A0A239DJ45_9PSED|nr:flagellar protein FlgN [Pseudomonas japonica]SNS31684.1 flagella synthesis protein FlgN [Pseudomonas japonica]
MHDTTLLQLIEEDIGPAEQLLQLLRDEYVALHGRDMPTLENILAYKQSLVVLLDQHGRRRSELLASIGLTPDRAGVEVLASQSHLGPQLLQQLDVLGNLLNECKSVNERNGESIVLQQATTANQIRILNGGEAPSLYDSRGSTSPLSKPRALSQA